MLRLTNVRKHKKRKGFTLIELVLVIAIIGVLATIIVPKFIGVADDASSKADLASARTIASAVTIALSESDGESINSKNIEAYLSNIKVHVSNRATSSGWSVVINYNDQDFTIYKDGDAIFPDTKVGQD